MAMLDHADSRDVFDPALAEKLKRMANYLEQNLLNAAAKVAAQKDEEAGLWSSLFGSSDVGRGLQKARPSRSSRR
jgi:hypothetical protein